MRILHTMLRVGDLQRSIDFYTQVMGMTLLRTTDRPDQQYTLAFLGYGRNPEHAEIELTYNYGVTQYELAPLTGTSPSASTTLQPSAMPCARKPLRWVAPSPVKPARSKAARPSLRSSPTPMATRSS